MSDTKPKEETTTSSSSKQLNTPQEQHHSRPGAIKEMPTSFSNTLPVVSVGVSESVMRELANRGKKDEVAFHRGVAGERVMRTVPYPETSKLNEDMIFDSAGLPRLNLLRAHFMKEGRLTDGAARRILRETSMMLRKKKNVAHIETPVTVCGDLHGQFFDLLTIFDIAGTLEKSTTKYLFLGDYVDRGMFSTEIVLYLCAALLNYPDRIVLLRGNHETRLMTRCMQFLNEVKHKFVEQETEEDFYYLFDSLQLAAVIHGTSNGDCFCVHGGIGPSIKTVESIDSFMRFQEIPNKSGMWDLVWADPLQELGDDKKPIQMSQAQWEGVRFRPNNFRHSSYLYGLRSVEEFLETNGLCCIIRGHEVQSEGYFEHFMETSHDYDIAPVVTIFSAPNYCDQYGNRGAFLQVLPERFVVQQFFEVPHPYVLGGFSDAVTWSLPLLLEGIVDILQKLVMDMIQEGTLKPENLSEEERKLDDDLARKTRSLYQRLDRVRTQQESIRAVQEDTYHPNMSLFARILQMDRENEACPADVASGYSAGAVGSLGGGLGGGKFGAGRSSSFRF